MDFARLTRGEAIAALSALALFVVMFLPWFSENAPVEAPGVRPFEPFEESYNAWEALSLTPVLLLLVILLVMGVALARAAGALPEDPALPPSLFVTGGGLLAVLLILYRLAAPPGPTVELSIGQADVGRGVGIFLGLLAASSISFGGYTELAAGQAASRARSR